MLFQRANAVWGPRANAVWGPRAKKMFGKGGMKGSTAMTWITFIFNLHSIGPQAQARVQ